MKKIILTVIMIISLSFAYATGNDFGAEGNESNDTFYYTGSEKIKLHYDPSTVVVFDFDGSSNIEDSKAKVARLYKNLRYYKHLDVTSNKKCNANNQVIIYNTDSSPIHLNETNHMLKVMDCYYLDDGMKVQPTGGIN